MENYDTPDSVSVMFTVKVVSGQGQRNIQASVAQDGTPNDISIPFEIVDTPVDVPAVSTIKLYVHQNDVACVKNNK